MELDRKEWYGLGTSLGVHVALLVLFYVLTAGSSQPQQLGYVEVDLGAFSEGQPMQQAEEQQPESAAPRPSQASQRPAEPEPEPEPQQPSEEQTEEAAAPVELPEQEEPVEDPEETRPTEEALAPEKQAPPNPEPETPRPQPENEPAPEAEETGGTQDGRTGESQGEAGEGAVETKAAPYNIEGLNRDPVNAPLPSYSEKVNTTIRVRITVDPQGRIVQRLPLLKGNPSLERSVLEALGRWRFNPLPAAAPQENQTGTITFTFRLE